MPGIDYRQLRQQVALREVLELLDWTPRWRRGLQQRGRCPLHGSCSPTSRSFAVHLGKQVYHCFVCGAGGNALDLWAAATRQGLYAAALDLCGRLGRDVPWLQRPATSAAATTTRSDP
jgi:DNA primase